jgi:hypothetical protein
MGIWDELERDDSGECYEGADDDWHVFESLEA